MFLLLDAFCVRTISLINHHTPVTKLKFSKTSSSSLFFYLLLGFVGVVRKTESGHILDSDTFVRMCSVLQSLKRPLYICFFYFARICPVLGTLKLQPFFGFSELILSQSGPWLDNRKFSDSEIS